MSGAKPDEKSLFNSARRLGSPEARREFLAAACGGDARLRKRVEALLRIYDEDVNFLNDRKTQADDAQDSAVNEPLGTVVGPYTLISRLGEGGMGVVYLADQTEPVRRQVALKIMRSGLDTRNALARFESERQALALMDHPNIARVLDGGALSAGRSYFAMEYVKGVPITQFCDTGRLTLRDRLNLFVQVCRGVQHAHQKGIVHRDLKPSNVLVTMYDGQPVPKIIDFGLAKSTDRTTLGGGHTQVGHIVGTPEYMSPEQADPEQQDIDTRSDVYSLGVLLYELLTGTTPLGREKVAAARYAEILERIRQEEPRRPSNRLDGSKTLASVAADRGVEPGSLIRQVRGDLDWITLKCLEKDRSRRYESVDGLARDVERFLRHEPVEASPPSLGYRLRKMARRHRGPLAAAFVCALLLLGGAGISVWQAMRAKEAEQRAVMEKNRAEFARCQVRHALDALTDDAMERLLARQTSLTTADREFLRKALALHEEFAATDTDTPSAVADVADTRARVGLIRRRLGDLPGAEEAYRGSIDLYRQLTTDCHDRPQYRRDLARTHVRLGSVLRETSRLKQAEEECTVAIGILQPLIDADPESIEYRRELATAQSTLGSILAATNRPDQSEACYRAGVDLLKGRATQPEDRRILASSYQNLGNRLLRNTQFEAAEEAYQASLDLFQALASDFPNQPDYGSDLAQLQSNIGALFALTNRRAKSEETFKAAVKVLQGLVAEYPARHDYRNLLAATQGKLGNLLTRMRQYEPAVVAYAAARVQYERLMADYPQVTEYRAELARSLGGLALLSSLRKDDPTAVQLLELAIRHDKDALTLEPANAHIREQYRTHHGILAEIFGQMKDYKKAAEAAEEIAKFGFEPARDSYTAAWILVRCSVLAKGDETLEKAYADRAMVHLQSAVRNGYRDAKQLQTEEAFNPLRTRDDFQQLIRKLEPPK